MSERLTIETVRHVASLARLDLTEDEIARFTEQFAAVLGHAQDIQSLNIDDVPPSTHAIPLTNVFRDDEVRPSLDRDKALASAPHAEDGQFRVPRILGEEP